MHDVAQADRREVTYVARGQAPDAESLGECGDRSIHAQGEGLSTVDRCPWPGALIGLLRRDRRFAREGRFDYLLLESAGVSEPLPVEEPRVGRRTVRTFPLFPPPQKN